MTRKKTKEKAVEFSSDMVKVAKYISHFRSYISLNIKILVYETSTLFFPETKKDVNEKESPVNRHIVQLR